MLSKLKGLLIANDDPILIECGMATVELYISKHTRNHLPAVGQQLQLHTQLIIRETEWTLFGFYSQEERILYRYLNKVSGVGPKLALAILSGYEVSALASHIEKRNIHALSAIIGVGKKTAERIGLELHGKLFSLTTEIQDESTSVVQDAIRALVGLGIKMNEAKQRIKSIPGYQNLSLEELIREGLNK